MNKCFSSLSIPVCLIKRSNFCSGFFYRGFTPYDREDYLRWKDEGRIKKDGVNAKVSISFFI